jgi:hypothetical protein
VPPGTRIGGRKSDPEIGLSQNRIILTAMRYVKCTVEPVLDFGAKRSALAVLVI